MKQQWRPLVRLTSAPPPDRAVFGHCLPCAPPLADRAENGRLLFCSRQWADFAVLWKDVFRESLLAISGKQSDICSLTLSRKEDHNGQEGIITLRA